MDIRFGIMGAYSILACLLLMITNYTPMIQFLIGLYVIASIPVYMKVTEKMYNGRYTMATS